MNEDRGGEIRRLLKDGKDADLRRLLFTLLMLAGLPLTVLIISLIYLLGGR